MTTHSGEVRERRKRLRSVTGGAPALPLVVLFLLNSADELDQMTYAIVAPEIRDSFGVSESVTVAIGGLSAALVIMLAVPIGFLADRLNRTRMVALAAALWGSMMVLTGLSGFVNAIGLLIIARLGAGLGRVMNEPVHMSLLADLYPPSKHGRVYSVHRSANAVGAMCVLACGALADVVGWRLGFILLSIPTFVALLMVSALREPTRGSSIDVAMAKRASEHRMSLSLRAAFRRLHAIRSLRRAWFAGMLLGGSVVPVNVFFNFFFEHEHGIDSMTARGAITMLYGAGALVGLQLGGRLATRAIAADELGRLARLAGLTLIGLAGAILCLAQAPWLAVSIGFVFVIGLGTSFNSYSLPLLAAVAPPRLRSQALGYFVFSIGLGALIVGPAVAVVGERMGYPLAMSILSVLAAVAGLLFASAGRHVRSDVASALADLRAEAEGRPLLEDGFLIPQPRPPTPLAKERS